MGTLFVLQLFRQDKYGGYRRRNAEEREKEDYPHYELRKVAEGIYPSLDKAETAMRAFLCEYGQTIYCCYVAEVPEGTMLKDFLRENLSLRLYDGKGMRLDERLFRSRPFANCLTTSENYGRRPEECRFRLGDVVEYTDPYSGRGTLGVVECVILERRDTPLGDDSDDGYLIWRVDRCADHITADEYGAPCLVHDHIRCTEVFESPIKIISGMADGADTLAIRYADEREMTKILFPANWKEHPRMAGILRNEDMLSIATHLVAFWDGKSHGTKHMIEIAHEKGIPVWVFEYHTDGY